LNPQTPSPDEDAAHAWQVGQQEQLRGLVLELLASGATLDVVLAALAHGVTALAPGMACMVLQVEGAPGTTQKHLRVAAAANLPDFFVAALDGSLVQAGSGGCATAAFTGEPVVVENTATHPYWASYRALALRAGIGACWSQPVWSASGEVLGVFSVYHPTPHTPTGTDLTNLKQLTRLTSIALVQHQAAKQLQDSEARFRALAEHTSEAIVVHQATRIVYVNPAAVKLFGASTESDLLGTSTLARIHPDYVQQQMSRLEGIVKRQPLVPLVESRFVRLDGSAFDVEVQGTAIVYGGENAVHVSVRDITRRKQTEQRLRVAASVFSHALEGILITTADGTIMDVNEAFTRITGYSRADVLGHNPRMLGSGRQDRAFYVDMWQHLTGPGQWSGELWNRRKTGEVYVQMQHISAVRDLQGQITQYVAIFSDITARKEQEARLVQMAHFDALTGLPNRVLKVDRLQQAMAQAMRRGQRLALVYIDLDGFKGVNDTHGHAAGDHLLIALSQLMKQALREGDTLARVGGDEFAAVLVDLDHEQDCAPLLQRLLQAANAPVPHANACLQVSASLGVTFYPQTTDLDVDQLLRQADQAMYQAKLAGKNRHHVFEPGTV
jgi:diguanylate cyclase (GGDEF)-like protein/PAS domain S-box-containing protein